MSPAFVHLRLHSEYSIVDGLVRVDDLAERCKELGISLADAQWEKTTSDGITAEALMEEAGAGIGVALVTGDHAETARAVAAEVGLLSPTSVVVHASELPQDEALLGATSTPWAPWTVVPADSKTHRNLMIATVVHDTLKSLELRYPPSDPALVGLKIT